MVRMREDQFTEGIKRSLYSVITSLEQDEAKYFLEEDASQIKESSKYLPQSGGISY